MAAIDGFGERWRVDSIVVHLHVAAAEMSATMGDWLRVGLALSLVSSCGGINPEVSLTTVGWRRRRRRELAV